MLVSAAIDHIERPPLPPGRSIELPGRGEMFVRELRGPANAPVVVLLHGWSATADLNWHPYFAVLGRHFRVIAVDHRGHGRGIRAGHPFRLEDCADDVAALAEVLGVDRLVVVGYSMGGSIAQLLWQRHPQLVAGLVFCSTSAMFRSSRRLRVLFGAAAAASAVGGVPTVGGLASSACQQVAHWNGRRSQTPWGLRQIARHDWQRVLEAGHQIGQFDARSWIREISVPTSVIATRSDDVVPTRYQLALAQAIPGATLRRVSGGHHQCVVDPDRYRPVLVEACREVVARSSIRELLESADAA